MTDEQKASPDEIPDRKDTDTPDELKAIWDEKESLRPTLTLHEVADRLIGNGVLRYIKDKRTRRLDELDEEPE
jgi:hypothetical protein